MNRHIRLKILKRIAEISNIPTTNVANLAHVGLPSTFSAINIFPSLRVGYQVAGAIQAIDEMSNYLNEALFYSSAGQITLDKLRQIDFNIDSSAFNNRDLRLLVLFSKDLFREIYNSRVNYEEKLTDEQYKAKIQSLMKSPNLLNLAQVNPSSQMATKIGNVKTRITDYLIFLNSLVA